VYFCEVDIVCLSEKMNRFLKISKLVLIEMEHCKLI